MGARNKAKALNRAAYGNQLDLECVSLEKVLADNCLQKYGWF